MILNSILDLTSRYIDDQLAKLNRVARALETTGCHAGNMAWLAPIGNPASRTHDEPLQVKLTHDPCVRCISK
jgi:hypothetical protein